MSQPSGFRDIFFHFGHSQQIPVRKRELDETFFVSFLTLKSRQQLKMNEKKRRKKYVVILKKREKTVSRIWAGILKIVCAQQSSTFVKMFIAGLLKMKPN